MQDVVHKIQRFTDIILKTIFGQRTSTRIKFKDGTYISFDEASYLLKREGKLRSGPCAMVKGVFIRDAVGVLEGHKPVWIHGNAGSNHLVCRLEHRGGMSNDWFRGCLHSECDTQPKDASYKNDDASMKIRAKHMSKYILTKKNLVY